MYVRRWVNHRADGTTCTYVGIVTSYRQGKKVYQKPVCQLGKLDRLQKTGQIDKLIQGLARFSRKRWVVADELTHNESPKE